MIAVLFNLANYGWDTFMLALFALVSCALWLRKTRVAQRGWATVLILATLHAPWAVALGIAQQVIHATYHLSVLHMWEIAHVAAVLGAVPLLGALNVGWQLLLRRTELVPLPH